MKSLGPWEREKVEAGEEEEKEEEKEAEGKHLLQETASRELIKVKDERIC